MTGRIIHVLCNDGSPLGVTERTMRGEDGRIGCGGAELALLTMCGAWQYYGNDVTLYNDPKEFNVASYKQKNISDFNPFEERDILIIFRSPNHASYNAKGKKIWWSCDQNTVGDFKEFAKTVQKIVTISPRHSKYFKDFYGINDTVSIDLPVRTWEYKNKADKIPKRCIYTSMPDRGIMELHAVWPRIHAQVPEASLVITSDWRLWSAQASEEYIRHYRLSFAHHPNVIYKAAVKRSELVKIQMEADVHLYPCIYDELFCISVAESQIAGAFPTTSDCGALGTTNMGRVIHGNAQDPRWQDLFVKSAVELLTDPDLPKKQEWIQEVSRKRFSVENILRKWDEVFV